MKVTLSEALKMGIDAHKAGRLQDAERCYVAILNVEPRHPDANHNMGILASNVGNLDAARSYCEAALASNSQVGQFWLTYIDVLFKLGCDSEARVALYEARKRGIGCASIDNFENKVVAVLSDLNDNTQLGHANLDIKAQTPPRVNEIRPASEQYSSRSNLIASREHDPSHAQFGKLVETYTQGNFGKSLEMCNDLLRQFPRSPRLYNLKGVIHKELLDFEKSIEFYQYALSIKPDYAEAYYNLGTALQDIGELDKAIRSYQKALSLKPDYAKAYYNMGNALTQKGKISEATTAYQNSIAINPNFPEAYYNLGHSLKNQGIVEDAISAYRKAIEIKPDYVDAQHILAALLGKTTKTAPRQYVERLFDQYADTFEDKLVGSLDYSVPISLRELALKHTPQNEFGSVLDLGCGTGLVGDAINSFCRRLEGIDISSLMLERARQKAIYDNLTQTDIVDYLLNAELNFDYFIAADVFIYLGDLSEVFRLIKLRNSRSGKLVFSTEHTERSGFQLEKTGRYSHSQQYIQQLCETFDYTVTEFLTTSLRKEKDSYLTGGLYILDF